MGKLRKFRRKEQTTVVAVRLDLDTPGFTYEKWGGVQRCRRGDWVVNNRGDTYTVDGEAFARTYLEVRPGIFEKVAPVWAERATQPGTIPTKEGSTDYAAGDFLVFNDPERRDGYAMRAATFEELYEPADS